MTIPFSGRCLCGAVRYTCSAEPVVAGHCKCEQCRRSSGTGHCSHLAVPEDAVSLSGETKVYESKADSGNTVGRAFCPTCGAAVYSVNGAMPGLMFLRASSLDDLDVFKPQMVVYAASGASWDHTDPDLPTFEASPPMEDMPNPRT